MNDTFYQLSLNILKALGGDVTIVYPDADAIWDEINKIYNNAGNRFDIVPLEKTITENGEYEYYPDGDVDAFMPVNLTVNIPQKYTDEQVFEIEANAIQQGYDNGYSEGETAGKLIGREEGYTDGFNTGYSNGVTDGGNAQKAKLVDITITENGTYTKDDGYKIVTVEVEGGIPEEELQQMLQEAMDEGYQDGYAEGVDDGREDGIAEQKEKLESTTITENGTYTREDGWNSVTVEVAGSGGGDSGKPKIYNGFRFTGGNIATVDFSQYDWSMVYDGTGFFESCSYSGDNWDNFNANFNGKFISAASMFKAVNNRDFKSFPDFSGPAFGDIHNAENMFQNNYHLTTISGLNTESCVSTNQMFYNCINLESVTGLNTKNVQNMENMFRNCGKLTTVSEIDTKNVRNLGMMFWGCKELTEVTFSDLGGLTSTSSPFDSYCVKLTTLNGCVNFGKYRNLSGSQGFLQYLTNLSYESAVNFLNGLYDRKSAGYSELTLVLPSSAYKQLTTEDRAIATNKGWKLSSY